MVNAQHPERVGMPLVVDTHRRDWPASNNITGDQRLLWSFELTRGKPIDDRKDAISELGSSNRVALCEVSDNSREVCLRFWSEVDRHLRRIESIV